MPVPNPTLLFRFMHVDNLRICLTRGRLCAPSHTPVDGLLYRPIHNEAVQNQRHITPVPCGPGGTIHDYVPFYFGFLSPMMLNLKTGRVNEYNEGQEPLIYLVTSAQAVQDSGNRFVFSNGHGLASFTGWFDNLANLDQIDWNMVYQRYWTDNLQDMDRQRRKQAEFLIYQYCDWALIQAIAVINQNLKERVESIMAQYDISLHKPVVIKREWYYY